MKQYSLYPSLTLLSITITLYLLACFSLLVYFNTNVLTVLTILLILLLVFVEIKKVIDIPRQKPELVSLFLSTNEIEWVANGDSQLFSENSVYTNRWGMILTLKNRWTRYNLILLADRFQHEDEYLDLRYQLIHMKQVMNAS